MTATRSWKFALICLLAPLGGCAGMSEGPVPVSQSTSPELGGLREAMRRECLDVSDTTAPQGDQARRNELVTAFMTAADMSYNQYERDLLAFSRQNDLGGALANQLLSAIGSASGSRALSQATNITTGAVTGTQSAFAKSLLNQTVSVLQTHMRAQRATQYALIVERLGWPYERWNTCMAFSDALGYEQAGTLNAALAAMESSAAEDERAGVGQAQAAIRRLVYSRDTLSVALRTYVGGGKVQNDRAVAALTDLITRRVIARPSNSEAAVRGYLGALMTSGSAAEQTALIRKIVELENGSVAGAAIGSAVPPE